MKTTDYKDKGIVDKYFKKTLAAVFINYPAFLRLLCDIKGKAVLDIGCGAGCLTTELAKKGALVSAIDNSPRWIDL
ncbi:MAG: methyltransferase domain-containing protein, partial [Candidatus Omnitrophica bacterium]|nr:methyltransferase domain-containing protein [Candidatus Omnitrophota bacterium]